VKEKQGESERAAMATGPAEARGARLAGPATKSKENEKRINVFLFLFMNKFVNSFSRDFELIEFCKNHSTHK
jgi:hypothetical protein